MKSLVILLRHWHDNPAFSDLSAAVASENFDQRFEQ
jgi:hypothetical protein